MVGSSDHIVFDILSEVWSLKTIPFCRHKNREYRDKRFLGATVDD